MQRCDPQQLEQALPHPTDREVPVHVAHGEEEGLLVVGDPVDDVRHPVDQGRPHVGGDLGLESKEPVGDGLFGFELEKSL